MPSPSGCFNISGSFGFRVGEKSARYWQEGEFSVRYCSEGEFSVRRVLRVSFRHDLGIGLEPKTSKKANKGRAHIEN